MCPNCKKKKRYAALKEGRFGEVYDVFELYGTNAKKVKRFYSKEEAEDFIIELEKETENEVESGMRDSD